MKKFKIQHQSIQKLSRKDQQSILGGRPTLIFCEYGCHSFFIADGDDCIIPTLDGAICRGTIQNNLCCVS